MRTQSLRLFSEALRQHNISLDDKNITHQYKQQAQLLCNVINYNLQKLIQKRLQREQVKLPAISQDKIGTALLLNYRLNQFEIRPLLKWTELSRKDAQPAKIRGQLVTEIYEHRDDHVTALQAVGDQLFISASSDSILRVFNLDTAQLNVVATSTAQFQIDESQTEERIRITCLGAVPKSNVAVVGTSKGSLRVYNLQRINTNGKNDQRRPLRKAQQLIKYNVGSGIIKIGAFQDHMRHCISYVTEDCVLGVQDLRAKNRTITHNLGRERGYPRALMRINDNRILVGTANGYLLIYDLRFDILSNLWQLQNDGHAIPISNLVKAPQTDSVSIIYPSNHYEFCTFNMTQQGEFTFPQALYTSTTTPVSAPYLVTRTQTEMFRLCKNTLQARLQYKNLPDFAHSFDLLKFLHDKVTLKEMMVRNIWKADCKHRYNLLSSLYSKKVLPFLEHTPQGLLTHINPTEGYARSNHNLSLLVDKRQGYEIERELLQLPNPKYRTAKFNLQSNADFVNSFCMSSKYLALGCNNSVIKVYC